jgi:hypothetical protein
MTLSLESYCVLRIALAEKILRDPDPRLRVAYTELRQEMFRETTQTIIDASREPAFLRPQA